jgi:transglutaminase-like putative cysteine protease
MSLDFAFRLSEYVLLGLACACLGYAEWAFLPEVAWLAVVVAVLLAAAFRLEGRWAGMSLRTANYVGGAILVLALGWLAWRFVRPLPEVMDQLPWPIYFLPFLGPVLMILGAAKLFRPKHAGDHWAMYGIGLVAVTLACALVSDWVVGALVAAYLAVGVWSLALFHLVREHRTGAGPAEPRVPLLRPASRWAVAAGLLGGGLFLLTPRLGEAHWEFDWGSRRLHVGYSADTPVIDLTRTGTLAGGEELAFTVRATDREGKPFTDLDPGQRWRGAAFDAYQRGKWFRAARPEAFEGGFGRRRFGPDAPGGPGWPPPPPALPPPPPNTPLPDLGPEQIQLTFEPAPSVGRGLFVADPLVPGPGGAVPVVTPLEDRQAPWRWRDGEVAPTEPVAPARSHYRQVTLPGNGREPGPPQRLERRLYDQLREPQDPHFTRMTLDRWTKTRLDELVRDGRLDPAARNFDENNLPRPEHHAAIARALTRYLGEWGGYSYTLKLERVERDLDPVEDFLEHSRQGHCERFATALALMLRSQRIPARVVLGFQGWEAGEDGVYLVRQAHAHSWVEVLLAADPRELSAEPREGATFTGRWLALDPTPAGEGDDNSLGKWFADFSLAEWFRKFLNGFSTDQWQEFANNTGSFLTGLWPRVVEGFREPRWNGLAGYTALAAGALTLAAGTRRWRRRRRARRPPGPGGALHARLLAVLGRHGHRPAAAQTPLEFATAVGGLLRGRPGLAAVADVPERTTRLYYRLRFGGESVNGAEAAAQGDLRRLAAALAAVETPGARG